MRLVKIQILEGMVWTGCRKSLVATPLNSGRVKMQNKAKILDYVIT